MAQTTVTFRNGTAGAAVGTETTPGGAFGDAASRVFVKPRQDGIGGSAGAYGQNADGTVTALGTQGNVAVPSATTAGATFAFRFRVHSAFTGDMEPIAPRVQSGGSTVKVANFLIRGSAGHTIQARTGTGTGTSDVPMGVAATLPTDWGVDEWGWAVLALNATGAYAKVVLPSGAVLYEARKTDAANGTGQIMSANLGKPQSVGGSIWFRDLVVVNAYDETLTPAPMPTVLTADAITQGHLRTVDVAPGAYGQNLTLTGVSITSGGAGVTDLTVDGLSVSFIDNPNRAVPLNLAFTLHGDGGDQAGAITVDPSGGYRVGRLVKAPGGGWR